MPSAASMVPEDTAWMAAVMARFPGYAFRTGSATAAAVAGDEVATQGAVRMARAALREGLSAPIVDIAAGLDPAPALTEALAR